nr:PREDICTED: uncharacterized protein LOC108221565 [Daucus carota subsp. sativus]
MAEIFQFDDGCPLGSVAGSSNPIGKGKSPRKVLADVTNQQSTVARTFHGRVNKPVATNKGLAAACNHCAAGSTLSVDLGIKANVHRPSLGMFSSENTDRNAHVSADMNGRSFGMFSSENTHPHTQTSALQANSLPDVFQDKRRKAGSGCPQGESKHGPKVKRKKSTMQNPENLKNISRNIFDELTSQVISHNIATHLDDGESSFIADDELYDDFLEVEDYDEHSDEFNRRYERNLKPVPKGYGFLGPPTGKCAKCQSIMWNEERCNKTVKKGLFKYNICCGNGKIKLPAAPRTPSYLWQLYNDPVKGPHFHRNTRVYNSMFAFTSTGGNVDSSINKGGSPYVYKLNGQNHHLFGALIPDEGKDPKFCQLYIYDTANEVQNRLRWIEVDRSDEIDEEIISGLIVMLDEKNELVKKFRSARDRFENNEVVELDIFLKVSRATDGRENRVGPSNEVAGILVGDQEETDESRDVIVDDIKSGLQRITNIHPKLMALQYPLLFPCGEDGFHLGLKYEPTEEQRGKTRESITLKDYYAYRLQVRHNEGMTPRLGGRLFQQYIVDAFSTIEQARLWWFRTHQTTLRSELYSHICDSIRSGDSDKSNLGKSFILPAGYVGSKRYMQQNFQDALAVCRHIGHPDIFLTMTSNPMWPEVIEMMKLIPFGTPVDNPDIIARVFKLKLNQLLNDIRQDKFFGTCIGGNIQIIQIYNSDIHHKFF